MEAIRSEIYDQGLRNYMTSIYNLMLGGLLVSAGAAGLTQSLGMVETLKQGGVLFWIIALSPLALVFAMSLGMERMKLTTLRLLYWLFVAIEGVGLALIISRYTAGSVVTAFLAAAIGFAGCSLFGYTTKRNLGPIGGFLIFALFGLIGLMILNIFLPSPGFTLLVSIAGVLIFAALTAWDTQTLKEAYNPGMDSDSSGRIVVMGALNLYLDFLNMFLFILRLVGVNTDD